MVRLRCGNKGWYSISGGGPEDFSISFDPYPFHSMSVRDAGYYTARMIASEHENIWIALSGGYDSEFVARCFHDAGIPFTPIIWRDAYDVESDYALHWCRKRNIVPKILNRNLSDNKTIKWLHKLSSKLCSDSILSSINIVLAKEAERNQAVLVTGTGVATPDFPRFPNAMGDLTSFAEYDFFIELWYAESKIKHPGSFFTYTPEIFYAIISRVNTEMHAQEFKAQVYELDFRPKILPYHLRLLGMMPESFKDKKHEYSTGTFQDLIDHLSRAVLNNQSQIGRNSPKLDLESS